MPAGTLERLIERLRERAMRYARGDHDEYVVSLVLTELCCIIEDEVSAANHRGNDG